MTMGYAKDIDRPTIDVLFFWRLDFAPRAGRWQVAFAVESPHALSNNMPVRRDCHATGTALLLFLKVGANPKRNNHRRYTYVSMIIELRNKSSEA